MFESREHGEIRDHTNGKDHNCIGEHAGRTRHFSHFMMRGTGPMACLAAKSFRNLNAMQLNVKQILHGIPWTAEEFGAKGCGHGTD